MIQFLNTLRLQYKTKPLMTFGEFIKRSIQNTLVKPVGRP